MIQKKSKETLQRFVLKYKFPLEELDKYKTKVGEMRAAGQMKLQSEIIDLFYKDQGVMTFVFFLVVAYSNNTFLKNSLYNGIHYITFCTPQNQTQIFINSATTQTLLNDYF